MPRPERKKEPTPTSIKVIMSVIAAIAALLLILTFADMGGLHLLMPELIPMGCVLEVLLLLTWLAMIIYRRRTDDHKKRMVMLVSALLGRERTLSAYEEAVREEYRFFSFGDATLIIDKSR